MSETVLVTGAGLIGSHVADRCLSLGMRVVGLDDLSGGFVENVPAGTTFVEGSVTDATRLARLFDEHSFKYVYHLAAYAAGGLSHFIRRFNYENNLVGTVNLINAPRLAAAHNQVFNVGADTPYSVLELADEIASAFRVERRVAHLPARNEVVHAFSSHEKVARCFGTSPAVSLREGVGRMVEWAKARGPTTPIVFKNIEVRKGLPPSWNV